MIAGQGTVEHVEFASSDPAATKRFFSDIFGWKWDRFDGSPYWIFETPTGASVGMGKTGRGQTPTVLVYLLTDDIDRTLLEVAKHGGVVAQPKAEISGVGFSASIIAPGGFAVALFQRLASR